MRTFTEAQNVRGWQGPLWVTQPNPLPKQGHPEQAAQDQGSPVPGLSPIAQSPGIHITEATPPLHQVAIPKPPSLGKLLGTTVNQKSPLEPDVG